MTRDATISEIILEKSADIKKEKAFIVLEGYDDIRCLKKIVTQNVVMILSFSGKDGVKEIVQHLAATELLEFAIEITKRLQIPKKSFIMIFAALR